MMVYTYGTRSKEKKPRDLDFNELCIESVKKWIENWKKNKMEKE